MKKLRAEFAFFTSQPEPMRRLLMANMVYALVLPLIELFIGAYILRSSTDVSLVIFFQLAQGLGIPITFMLNAYMLRFFSISYMYSLGMVLSGLSMGAMMLLPNLDYTGVAITGFSMGLAYGFFWANRVNLTLAATRDENRNYFYGLETFFFTSAFIIMPLIAGYFIAAAGKFEWFGGDISVAYYIITALVILLTLVSTYIIRQGSFKTPVRSRFIYFRFHRLWNKMLYMAVFKGATQGFIVAAPVILIMKLVGNEGSLASIQSGGALLSALLLYVVGRKSHPRHRLRILGASFFIFLLGASINMIMFDKLGVLLFVACLIFSRPLLDLAYFPIQLGVMECMAEKEGRSQLSYIFSHEVGLFAGRLFGCSIFILTENYFGDEAALRYVLFAVALVQSFSILFAQGILRDKYYCEVKSDTPLIAATDLKEPVEL